MQVVDAKFEVLGGPNSILSVSLSASQNLYTRRGTLIGVGGKAENVSSTRIATKALSVLIVKAISTLSFHKPFRRAFLGLPFLYQRLSSATPLTALISSNGSLAVVQLDGSKDWKIPGKALLAWTGQTISVTPSVNWGEVCGTQLSWFSELIDEEFGTRGHFQSYRERVAGYHRARLCLPSCPQSGRVLCYSPKVYIADLFI